VRINKVYHANVYVDGTNNLVGRASEITLPEIAAATDEHAAIGMIGTLVLPTGLEALSVSMKWNGYYADRLAMGANPFQAHKLQVRASIESYEAAGRVGEQPLVIMLIGRWTKAPLGTFAHQSQPELEDELACTYLKVTIGGEELVEIDVMENVWRVRGEDVLAGYRANLGG
jgi:P2 family phage contractile tail tube protein